MARRKSLIPVEPEQDFVALLAGGKVKDTVIITKREGCYLVERYNKKEALGWFYVSNKEWPRFSDAFWRESYQLEDQVFDNVEPYMQEGEDYGDCVYRLIADGDVEPDVRYYEKYA